MPDSEDSFLGRLGKPVGSERRAYVRQPYRLGAFYQPGPGEVDRLWLLAEVRDLSRGGIALVLGCKFDPGTEVAISLQGTGHDFTRTLEAKVIHVTRNPGGGWTIGCEFLQRLSEAEFQGLLAEAPPVGGLLSQAFQK